MTGGPRDLPGGGMVGIVGAGTMGAGIAQACLVAGWRVRLHDLDPAALARARERIDIGLERLVARDRLTPAQRDASMAALELVGPEGGLSALAQGAELIIEAAAEDRAVKELVFSELDEHSGPEVVLATNTSSLSVAACAAATRRPERVLGLHFFNPAPLMALVELAAAERTSRWAIERAVAFVASLDKTVVRCADAPGFIVNRVGRPWLVEAVRLLEAGEGTVSGIDAALEAAGYPMGPFRLIDLIGLDVDLAIDEALLEAFAGAARFAPPALEQALARAGRLGRKRGHGFYRYAPDAAPTPDVELEAAAPIAAASIVERLELAVVNEAYRAVEEGVAAPADIDLAMRLGAGHPRGPFERVDELGLRYIVVRLRELHVRTRARSGDQYEVAPSLWQMATV